MPELAKSARGIGVRQVRIACGLVMFSYLLSHFTNHALGNISYAVMETWLTYHIWWWRIPIVNVTLYSAAATHLALGLWALYQRRHFRYTAAEIAQLLLGLSIPLWLASHFGAVRLAGVVFGRDPPNYAAPLLNYWVTRPHMIVGAVRPADGGMDARLYRTLFLAAAETVFQMGGAIPAGGGGPAAAVGDARHTSRCARSHPTGR